MLNNKESVFKNLNYSIDIDYLKKNMISINVFWKKIEYTLIEESPTTTELDLIANVGGILGNILKYILIQT
jgi:hypothetical protein